MKLDVNKDGDINAVDASMVLAEYAAAATDKGGSFTTTQIYLADYDCNRVVDAVDASNILATYAYNSTSDEPKPITKIAFLVQGKDPTDSSFKFSSTAYDYEDCLAVIAEDKEVRLAEKRYSVQYTIWKDEQTYTKPVEGTRLLIYKDTL